MDRLYFSKPFRSRLLKLRDGRGRVHHTAALRSGNQS
jgi:hypothetical protein